MKPRTGRIAVIAGAVLVAVAAFLPWASIGIITIEGTRGDGVIAIALGLILAIVAGVSLNREQPSFAATGAMFGLSLLSLALYAWKLSDLTASFADAESTLFGRPEVGAGLYLGIAGGVIALVGSLFAGRRSDGTVAANRSSAPPAWGYPERKAPKPDHAATLASLSALHDTGTLTDDEYAAKKAEVLARV